MEEKVKPQGSHVSYFIGFLLSIILTMAAYVPVSRYVASGHAQYSKLSLTIFIIALAIVQLFVQLVFFLHLAREKKPRWRSAAFVLALIFVFIVVAGSLWIMNNLNYRMTPKEMQQYMRDQASGGL